MENRQRLRYRLTKYVENCKSNHNLRPVIEEILKTSSKLKERYCCIDVVSLLRKNVQDNSVSKIRALIEALKVLEKYGKNLLRDDRPMFWRVIMFSNQIFKEKVDIISGSRDILKQMGYTETIIDGFSFPNTVESPNIRIVSFVTSDIVLLRYELVLYLKRQHPSPNGLKIGLSCKSSSSSVSSQSQGQPSTSKSSEPSLDSLCALCGQNLSEFHCPTCKKNQCSSCDHKWHLNRGREDHQRDRILPSFSSQSSTNIIDEPIPTSATQLSGFNNSVFFPFGFASPLLIPVTSQIKSIESPFNNTKMENVSLPTVAPLLTSNFTSSAETNLDWEEKFELKKEELSSETDISSREQIFTKFCQEIDLEIQKYTDKANGLEDHLLSVKHHFMQKAEQLLKQKNSLKNHYFSLNPNLKPKNFDDKFESRKSTEQNDVKISHKLLEASCNGRQEPFLPIPPFLHKVGDPVLAVPAKAPPSTVTETLNVALIRTENIPESNAFSSITPICNGSLFEKPITVAPVLELQHSSSHDDDDETVPAVVSDRRTVQFQPPNKFNLAISVANNQSGTFFQSQVDPQSVAKKESLRLKCLKTVGNLRLAQSQGFDAQNLPVALEKANIDLIGNLQLKKLENFKAQMSKLLQVYPCMSFSEACKIFYLCDGNLTKTQEAIELQHSAKLKTLCHPHLFNNTDLIESLKQNDGNCSKAVLELQKPLVQDFVDRLQEPSEQKLLVKDFLNMRDDEHLKSALVTLLSIKEIVVADVMCCILSKIRDHLEPYDDFLHEVKEYDIDDVHEAATSFPDSLELAIKYLNNKCKVCFGSFPQNKLTCMVACRDPGCIYCHDCLAKHLDIIIRERNIRDLVCPVCMLPDLDIDEEATLTHFNHLDKVIKEYLGEQIHEMYQKKLRDDAVRKMPNFRWCSHCENGFIYDDYENLRMVCSACNQATCYNCKKPWEVQHEGISCQAFLEWKQQNDEDFQAKGLAAHLKEHGIDCPSCNYRYALAKGGCMHFKCLMCSYQFCSGCKSPFKLGRVCNMMPDCSKRGLHAHHPRDCLFYLRDFEIDRLQHILSEANVSFGNESKLNSSYCSVLEQKETSVGLVDEPCGREVLSNSADLCVLHYKEYLVNLINSNHLDPAVVFSVTELEVCLTRANKNFPSDTVENYRELLLSAVKLLPLIHEKRALGERVADNQRTAGATTSFAV